MMKAAEVVKSYLVEIAIIFLLLFAINNFFGNEKVIIKSDGAGYYDYLPSLFIYGDFPSKDIDQSDGFSERVNNLSFYVDYKEHKINKYPCGTAVLLSPFFYYAHLNAASGGHENNGFSQPYQKSVFYASVFYLFLGLVFLRKLLSLYHLSRINIAIVQFLTVFSTSIINYTSFDPSFSHVYSFFAITAFLFFAKSYFLSQDKKQFLWACVFIGLIFLLRQINIIIILFVPFLAGSYANLKSGVLNILKNMPVAVIGIVISFSIVCIQLFLWHYQTGRFLVYSYQGEGFNSLSPSFFDVLFSYRKGLFVYTPIVFIALFGGCFLIKNKSYYLLLSWFAFFVLLTYIISSWHDWGYGCSYGHRAYIDFYAVFFILLAFLLEGLKFWPKLSVILISLLTVSVTVIQTKQYKEYILHWNEMDKQKYWEVFLKLEDRFKGLVWKKSLPVNDNGNIAVQLLYSESIKDVVIPPNTNKEIYVKYSNAIGPFKNADIVQVAFENDFDSEQEAQVEFTIRDSLTNECYYYHNPSLIHFCEKGLNKFQQGFYNYEINRFNDAKSRKIALVIVAKNKEVILKKVKISFWGYV